ncbi:MAG: hypothetical protein MJ146_02185 [Clostridia bacterium]|nr:hypothetical protein [Clostridia bacterium]
MKRKILSMLLILCITVTFMPTLAFADAAPKFSGQKYIYIGDSMSYNFATGKHNYTSELGLGNEYPALVAQELFGMTNNIEAAVPNDFRAGGIRTTDVYYFINGDSLDDSNRFQGDQYTITQYENQTERAFVIDQNAIRQADAITIQLGHSNISTYLLGEILAILGVSGDEFDTDLSKIFTDEEIAQAKPLAQQYIQKIGLDKLKLDQLEAKINEELLKDNETVSKVNQVMDAMVYAMVSDVVHFDRLIGEIYRLNPDVKIYVLGLFNPLPDLDITYTLNGKKITFPIKKLGKIFEFMNAYYKTYSQYSDQYIYVPPVENVETYGKLIRKESNVNEYTEVEIKGFLKQMITAQFNDDEGIDPDSQPTDFYNAIKDQLDPLVDLVYSAAQDKELNLNVLLDNLDEVGDLANVVSDGGDQAIVEYLNSAMNAENQDFTKLVLQVLLFAMDKGIYVHPTKAGHRAMADNVEKYIKDGNVDQSAVDFHAKEKKVEKQIKLVKAVKEIIFKPLTNFINYIKKIFTK